MRAKYKLCAAPELLALTSHMIADIGFRTNILNWVTSFPEISGVYILASHERPTKQIQSKEFLLTYMDLLSELSSVDLDFIAGHMNTESLLFSLIDGGAFSFGSFENTRMFSIDKFIESDDVRRGPKARIYVPGLLNWIQFDHAKDIMNTKNDLWSKIYTALTQMSVGDLAQTQRRDIS